MTTPEFIDSLTPHCLGHRDWLFATYMLARDVIDRNVRGDFVECGVYAGAHCAVMARVIAEATVEGRDSEGAFGKTPIEAYIGEYPNKRRVHLFDSFQGIPAVGPEDLEMTPEGNPAGSASCPMADVQENMSRWKIHDGLLVYHPGWFADTMPSCGVKAISLLRIDCDLYESTRPVMKYLYPLVTPGGWVIVDDWPLSGCRKAVQEVIVPQPIYFQKEAK
jgi:O-methyltransferase